MINVAMKYSDSPDSSLATVDIVQVLPGVAWLSRHICAAWRQNGGNDCHMAHRDSYSL
jgi:hypothetical protein